MTDGLNGLQQGGRSGLADLYRRYSAWLTARVAHRFGSDQAEDLAQETWLRIAPYQARGEIRHPKALLLRIASNLAIDADRRHGGREADLKEGSSDAPVDSAPQAERLLMKQVILSLPQPLRDVFLLSRFACLTYDEIGERLGISTKPGRRHGPGWRRSRRSWQRSTLRMPIRSPCWRRHWRRSRPIGPRPRPPTRHSASLSWPTSRRRDGRGNLERPLSRESKSLVGGRGRVL